MPTFLDRFKEHHEVASIGACGRRHHALIGEFERCLLALAKAVYKRAMADEAMTQVRSGFNTSNLRRVMESHFAWFGDVSSDVVLWLSKQEMLGEVASDPAQESRMLGLMQLLETHVMNEDISLANSVETEGFSTSEVYVREGRLVAFTSWEI